MMIFTYFIVPNVHSLILFWASKEKASQPNPATQNKTELFCYLDLLFEELWQIIFSYCGVPTNKQDILQLEMWISLRSVSKLWCKRLERVQSSSININSVTVCLLDIISFFDSYLSS